MFKFAFSFLAQNGSRLFKLEKPVLSLGMLINFAIILAKGLDNVFSMHSNCIECNLPSHCYSPLVGHGPKMDAL